MVNKKVGNSTIRFDEPPTISAFSSIVGKKEGEGPLGGRFDYVADDDTFQEKTWEKAESRMQKEAVSRALFKAGLTPKDIDYICAGDLLNQCIGSNFGLRDFNIKFLGLFGACSTMAETLAISSILINGGFADKCISVTSSHFCTAERQFRFPLEYGGQRPPSAQWTVTGCGCAVLECEGEGPYIKHITIGRMQDYGIKDSNNMGAAMVPAAVSTMCDYFKDTGTFPENYDLIVTGDLGSIGHELVKDLMGREGFRMTDNYKDCGMLIYDLERQDVHAGGSGCGCSAVVLTGDILPKIKAKILNNVLFIGTGALMSTVSTQQGESIPGIAHLINITSSKEL